MGNWWFVLATAVVAVVTPGIGRLVRPEAFGAGPVVARETRGRPAAVPVGVSGVAAVEGVADARP